MSSTYGREGIALRETEIETGKVRGVPGNNPLFTVFKGIPYAKPPVGDLRWRMPQPPDSWEGVRECDRFGNIPCQFMDDDGIYTQSEDCLYLNVWTPAHRKDEKLPVLFWVYGGAFMGGYSNKPAYDGEALCREGVIMVSFNYRTGPLGMLSHPKMREENPYGSSGNLYYLDQIFALKWTRRNIAAFGGDPDRITIMGHSSGSVAVTSLAVSPLTAGDMAGCIILSGPVTRDFMDPDHNPHSSPFWISEEEADARGREYMELCGCRSLEEMRRLTPKELGEAYKKTKAWLCHFRGVIDGYVFPKDPAEMYFHGEHHPIHYMIAQAGDEGMHLSSILTRQNVAEYAKNFGDREEEFLGLCGSMSDGELAGALMDDNAMRCRFFAESQLKNGMEPAYMFCTIRRVPGDEAGAHHGVELPYIFGTLNRSWRDYSGDDYELSRKMTRYIANFVRRGDPNGEGLPSWTPYTEEKKEVLMVDVAPWMGERKLSRVQRMKIDYLLSLA